MTLHNMRRYSIYILYILYYTIYIYQLMPVCMGIKDLETNELLSPNFAQIFFGTWEVFTTLFSNPYIGWLTHKFRFSSLKSNIFLFI